MSQANEDWPPLRRVELLQIIEENKTTRQSEVSQRSTQPQKRSFLFGVDSISLGENAIEQEITFQSNNVRWSSHGVVIRQFTFREEIKDVRWVYMPKRCLCILMTSRISFYEVDEQRYDYPLSPEDKIEGIWPLPRGILLEVGTRRTNDHSDEVMHLKGVNRFYYLREFYTDYVEMNFFNISGEEKLPGKIIWTSTDLPLAVTQNASSICVWRMAYDKVDSIATASLKTPPPKRRIEVLTPSATKAKMNADTLMRVRNGETPAVPRFVFEDHPPSSRLDRQQCSCLERCITPFYHFRLNSIVTCVSKDDEATSAHIAGSTAGCFLMLAVHCNNTARVYFFEIKQDERTIRFDKTLESVVSITSINAFSAESTRSSLYDAYFLTVESGGIFSLFQGIARLDDVNMHVYLPASGQPRLTPSTEGGMTETWKDVFTDTIGPRVTIRLPHATQRYSIDIRPRDEVAVDCFVVIRRQNCYVYRAVVKNWIRHHLSTTDGVQTDWLGFCEAVHMTFNFRFITNANRTESPRVIPSSSSAVDENSMRQVSAVQSTPGSVTEVPAAAICESPEVILTGLHDLYENYKLDTSKWIHLKKLGHLLSSLAMNCGCLSYLDYYARDFTLSVLRDDFGVMYSYAPAHLTAGEGSRRHHLPQNKLFALLEILHKGKRAKTVQSQTPAALANEATRFFTLCTVIDIIKDCSRNRNRYQTKEGNRWRTACYLDGAKRAVDMLMENGWDKSSLRTLPFGFGIPIRECLHALKELPPTGWTTAGYRFIGREDVIATVGHTCDEERLDSMEEPSLNRAKPALRARTRGTSISVRSQLLELDTDCARHQATQERRERLRDGFDDVFDALDPLRFRDDRLDRVRMALNTALPQDLGIRVGLISDRMLTETIRSKLSAVTIRTLATTIGRGAFALNTVYAAGDVESSAPPICLSGRVRERPQLASFGATPAETEEINKVSNWPEFHQAVSAALKLKPDMRFTQHFVNGAGDVGAPSNTNAGYWMAAGIQGRLSKSDIPAISTLLGTQHDMTQIGAMLGFSICMRGSQDVEIEKMALLHLPQYHPKTFPEAEWCSASVQTAMLLSIGFLRAQSNHYTTTKRMLDEVSRRAGRRQPNVTPEYGTAASSHHSKTSSVYSCPVSGVTTDREGYALAAGFAIGLVNLGNGNALCGYYHDRVIKMLKHYVLGGVDPFVETVEIANQVAPLDTLLGPGGIPWCTGLEDAATIEHIPLLYDNLQAEHTGQGNEGDQANVVVNQSNVVLDGEYLDTDITSPAATYALALMFLKTHNEDIVKCFELPWTQFDLDLVRPDFVMHRVLATALIMWDDIRPTEEWIQSMLPPLMTNNSISRYFEENASAEMHDIGQAHIHGIAGGCLAIGLRYASTNDEQGRLLLTEYLHRFLEYKLNGLDGIRFPKDTFGKIDKMMLETIISVLAIALGILMAGSGHMETFVYLNSLRRRVVRSASLTETVSDIAYGDYMAVTMAIGFLFLGGGQQGFKTDNLSIACLLISVFPKFQILPMDNRVHLQAFRHLYALAAENRMLSAVDTDTGLNIASEISISVKTPKSAAAGGGDDDDQGMNEREERTTAYMTVEKGVTTPCLLPERHLVVSLRVTDKRFREYTLTGRELDCVYQTLKVHVKMRQCLAPSDEDPYAINQTDVSLMVDPAEIHAKLTALSNRPGVDSVFAGFAKTYCSDDVMNEPALKEFGFFCRSILPNCITQDAPEILTGFVQIQTLMQRIKTYADRSKRSGDVTVIQSSNPRFEIEHILWMLNFVAIVEYYKNDTIRYGARMPDAEAEDARKLPGALIPQKFIQDMKKKLWNVCESMEGIAADLDTEAEDTSQLKAYYDARLLDWHLQPREQQLCLNCILAACEAPLLMAEITGSKDDRYRADVLRLRI